MTTVKDREQEIVKSQLIQNVRDLINCMNSESDLDIAIIEDQSSGTTFEFSLEYPPYEDSLQKFQRRVSNIDSIEFINNVFDNIEEIMGFKYKKGVNFIKTLVLTEGEYRQRQLDQSFSDSGILYIYKKVHIRIQFVEDTSR